MDVGNEKRKFSFIIDRNYIFSELVPRFYLETALLKCYKFSCEPSGFPAILERLTLMIRGFGNPVAAAFARMYLVKTTELGNIKLLSIQKAVFFIIFQALYAHYLMGIGPNTKKKIPQNSGKQIRIPEGM